MSESTTLTESVEQAFKTETEPTTQTDTTTAAETTKTETDLEKERVEAAKKLEIKEDEVLEIEASADEIRNALNLSRTLSDPQKAAAYIKFLADQGGYDLTRKSDVKELVKDSKSILKDKLGDAYDVLGGDALASAFDEILKVKVAEATKPLEESSRLANQAANEQKADAAMQSFFSRNNIKESDREVLAGKMMAKMSKMPPTAGADVNEYLDDIYTVVNKGNATVETTKKVVDKMVRNAKEAKVSGEGSGAQEERIKIGSKNPSLDEAVRAGFEGKRFDFS